MANDRDERSPLLRDLEHEDTREIIEFSKEDDENPRHWSRARKLVNVAVIAFMAVLSPLASSMFTPGIEQIAADLKTSPNAVVGATTGFLVLFGIGPLILAPLSETFGRRRLYLVCFSVFAILQVPTALSPNIETLLVVRTVSGFFGSVGIANGGGTISDMFDPSERASIFGWYLLGPLLGPTLGPLFGGLIVQNLSWRWVFWVLAIVCTTNTIAGFLFLKETYAPVLLETRKQNRERADGGHYKIANEDSRPFRTKLLSSMNRPLKILFTQPIVLIMSIYQAIIFGTNYSLYTNFQAIFGEGYGFSTTQVGLLYLAPGLGFLASVLFLIPHIDTIYNALTARNKDVPEPEFRLPLANIGAVLVPLSLFWFAWTVEYHVHWAITILSTVLFGLGQITIMNCVQNYYIDSFSKYVASAIAAGTVFRSIVGGVAPLFAPALFDKVGYGWGISTFGFCALALTPSPVLFYYFGGRVRKRFAIEF